MNNIIKVYVAAYALADFLRMCQCSNINEVAFTKEDGDGCFYIRKEIVDNAYYRKQAKQEEVNAVEGVKDD